MTTTEITLIALLIWFGSAWLFLWVCAIEEGGPITRKTVTGALIFGPITLLIVAWIFAREVAPTWLREWRQRVIARRQA